jgi:hypothetical protein
MGLTIHSLAEFPDNVDRGYFLYLLDSGWSEPLGNTLHRNFEKMADLASRHNAVVMRGTPGSHFNDDVLSWHHINGIDAKDILPAIMISRINPKRFRDVSPRNEYPNDARLVLIPLRQICKTSSDVSVVIDQVFGDILEKKRLSQFAIQRELRRGEEGSVLDALILQPKLYGVGVDLKTLFKFLRGKKIQDAGT